MNVLESIRVSLRGLSVNKMRSFLTMLGIIIGVAAVIALMSVGRGAQAAITEQIESLGTNLLFVFPGSINQAGVQSAAGSAASLTLADAEALMDPLDVPAVALVAPIVSGLAQVIAGGQNVNTQIRGTTADYQQVRNADVQAGEFIQPRHVQGQSRVAALGSQVAQSLFEDLDPVGQTVRINRVVFRVIGVMEAKGGTSFGSQDDMVFVPITTAQQRLLGSSSRRGERNVSQIYVQVADGWQTEEAIWQISELLRQRHRVTDEDDFTVLSQEDMLSVASQITGVLTIFLSGVAAISLVVGGIGIMNIMLVSVTERTREIGIRKAVGARRRDILAQFLIEAIILSIIGGSLGILIGSGISRLIARINVGGTSLQTVVGLDSVLLAVIFSSAVGLFFGLYPAARAAALNPIEALRYE